MSINIKKYTKDQMAQMVEEAQSAQKEAEDTAATYFEGAKKLREQISKMETQERTLRAKNAALTEQLDQMNGEAINKANEIANLKADSDALRTKLADTEAALGRANAELGAAEGALGKMNDKIVRCEEYSRSLRGDVNKLQLEKIGAIMRANYAEAHPWRNLWAWVKRKLVRHK